jgi:SAM-dependent methyltransferase
MSTSEPTTHYDAFYAQGGWRYPSWRLAKWRAKRFLARRIVEPLQLEPGAKILEVGCGMGLHSHLLAKLGFDVTAVDVSEVGIAYARRRFRKPRYLCSDAAELGSTLEPESFDVIFVRGMSWYHYELDGKNLGGVDVPAQTRQLFDFLPAGGLFVLQIFTDFSGQRPAGTVHNNRVEDYTELFEQLGDVVLVTDWMGRRINPDTQQSNSGIIIATRKPGVGEAR